MLHLQRREVLIGLASVTLAQVVFGRTGALLAADRIKPTASSALIVVDVQNCFLPGGSLAVKEGYQVIPVDISEFVKAEAGLTCLSLVFKG